jgi:HK97 family phage portal protein
MGLWQRLTGRTAPVETRDFSGFSGGWPGPAAAAYVNPVLSENLGSVVAAVNVIASAMSSLPAYVYQRVNGERIEAVNHPVTRLIRQPNNHQTWPDWVEWTFGQVLMRGNALSAIEVDGAGRPIALLPIPWQFIRPLMLPSGRLAFDVVAWQSLWGGTGIPRRYLENEVLLLKDRSDDGLIGRSRISRAPDTISNALELQSFASHAWRNQATPSGAVEIAASLNEPSFNRLRDQFNQRYTGTDNARKVLILDNGAAWKSMSVSPEDAEVLNSRKFTVEEIARLFQVPPPLIQDYTRNTFTNATTAGLWFAQFSLAPWASKLEAEFSRSVFGAGSNYELEIDLSGLVRGDYAARWAAYAIAIQNKILTADEIREAEGWNPMAGPEAPGNTGEDD